MLVDSGGHPLQERHPPCAAGRRPHRVRREHAAAAARTAGRLLRRARARGATAAAPATTGSQPVTSLDFDLDERLTEAQRASVETAVSALEEAEAPVAAEGFPALADPALRRAVTETLEGAG